MLSYYCYHHYHLHHHLYHHHYHNYRHRYHHHHHRHYFCLTAILSASSSVVILIHLFWKSTSRSSEIAVLHELSVSKNKSDA